MAPKPKGLRTPKTGVKTKNKRKTQPPPDPVSDDFVTEEDETHTQRCAECHRLIGYMHNHQ